MNTQVISWQKAVLALALVATVATAGFLSTRAFFSDTETSEANVFAAGSLDLKVGIVAPANAAGNFAPQSIPGNRAMFEFENLMPGDSDSGRFRLESTQDAYACIAGDITDGESEMGQYMEIALWQDNNNNGDGIIGDGERSSLQVLSLEEFANGDYYALQDSTDNRPLQANSEYQHEFAYCFGEFERNSAGNIRVTDGRLSCDGSTVSNDMQGKTVETTIHFYAEQMQNNDNFVCADVATDDEDNGGVVSGDDLNGWVRYNDQYVGDGTVLFVPDDSTVGDGSLQLTTVGGNSRVGLYTETLNVPLNDAVLRYDSRQISATDTANGNATMRIMIDIDGDNDVDDQLMYEPYYNGFNGEQTWETWDISESEGQLWSNYQVEYNDILNTGAGGVGQMVTLADVLSEYPNAKIVGISFSMGTGNPDQVVLVDNFVINGTVYDFEE